MEFLAALATGLLSKIGEILLKPIARELGHLVCQDNINKMKDELEAIRSRKQEVQRRVDDDKRAGRVIEPNVENWLHEVADKENELERFCADELHRNQKCLGGWCPNLITRYSHSKRAQGTVAELLSLKEAKLETISYEAAPLKWESIFTKGFKSFDSRKSIVSGVIEKLKDDKFKRISICGMGGVGKTTLVKEVIKIVEADRLFDQVVMTVVSQTPDYKKIQGDIADRLGLKFDKEGLQGRAHQLLKKINETPKVLIVMDDVWSELDFESIGLPCNEDDKACKFIFTSRNQRTCRIMGSQENFDVNILSREESWDLFQDMIGDDFVNNPDVQPIAIDIVNECGGLPIAIVTVGKALQGKKKYVLWQNARKSLRESSGTFSDVQKCIKLSYDLLGSQKGKYILSLCCLYPDDADIPVDALVRQGWGLGLFDNCQFALWEARNQVCTLIDDLKGCYLLLDSNEKDCVKMHDVVRDVVISIASAQEHGFKIQCDAQKEWHGRNTWKCNSVAVSVMVDKIEECPNIVECPKLQLLQMSSDEQQYIPINSFQGIGKLNVLGLENFSIPKVSTPFQALNNLRTLCLENCQIGDDISIIGKELTNLEILSFAHSNIKEFPIEMGQLGSLRLLDLTRCDYLHKFSSNVLTKLFRLEEFYFVVNYFPWLQNKFILNELKIISSRLKVVGFGVRMVQKLPKDFFFENLQRFWVYLTPYADYHKGYLDFNVLKLAEVDMDCNFIKSSLITQQLVKKCEILHIEKVGSLKNAICILDEGRLPCLKDLQVTDCCTLEYLLDIGKEQKSTIIFPNLEKLILRELPLLISFSKAINLDDPYQPMSQLQEPRHSTQPGSNSKLSGKLFSYNMVQQFPRIETIVLEDCTSLEMVFDLQGLDGQSSHDGLFPQLKEIEINWLDEIKHVWGNVPHSVQGFQSLRSLTISHCYSLTHIFTPGITTIITRLEKLEISYCMLMENLVASDEDNEGGINRDRGKWFEKLDSLTLSNLPRLVCICTDSHELEWQSLRKVSISNCPKLNVSFLLTQMHAKQDNPTATLDSNPPDVSLVNISESYSKSSNWHLSCTPFPKLILRGSTNNRSSKGESSESDHVPSVFEMKNKVEFRHMPILVDLHVAKSDSLDALFQLDEKYNSNIQQSLKAIKIENCDKLETIMATGNKQIDLVNSFSELLTLDLQKLSNLVSFCMSSFDKLKHILDISDENQRRIRCDPFINRFLFPNLISLTIEECNKINILFSSSSVKSLKRLQKLEVSRCENIEEIISQEEREASTNNITFCGLQHLFLRGLPNLKAFSQGSYEFNFPSLREVTIKNCPNLEVFSRGSSHTPKLEDVNMAIGQHKSKHIEKRDLNATLRGFKTFVALQVETWVMPRWSELHNKGVFGYFIEKSEMTVDRFNNLETLVPFNEMGMLRHLKVLTIRRCDSLVDVFASEGVDVNKWDATAIEHYELREMTLERLPKLRNVWRHNVIGFQKLTSIKIEYCHSLKSLLSFSVATSLVELQKLHIYDCSMMEEVVSKACEKNSERGSRVRILFPKLKSLVLWEMPRLECFCSGDYDYDLIPLCDDDKEMNKAEISFPELQYLRLGEVPKLKCFCSGVYDYNLMNTPSISCNGEIIEDMSTFPDGNVIVNTPKLSHVSGFWVQGGKDLNMTIHYIHDYAKYEEELRKLETFRCLSMHTDQYQLLRGYLARVSLLWLERCDRLLHCFPSNMMHFFQHIEDLTVRECVCMEEIFESDEEGVIIANGGEIGNTSRLQYQLKSMRLHNLPQLRHIWRDNHGLVIGFQNLRGVTIIGCHNLRYVFPLSIAGSLPNLYRLYVSDCNGLEEIITSTREEQVHIHNVSDSQQPQVPTPSIIFPELWELKLDGLPNLICFYPTSCDLELPWCREVDIKQCPKLETFCYGALYTPQLYQCYGGLNVEGRKYIGENLNEVIRARYRSWR